MREWFTLLGFCLTSFSNGSAFGLYTSNLQSYAIYFQTTQQALQNTFYIGLIVEILMCLPAIKFIEWRLDYAIITAAYLTTCSYLLQYLCVGNIIIVIVALALNSIAQLFVLPTPLYLSEVWFSLEKRPFAIALGFYSNLLGFGTGGTVSSLLSYNSVSVKQILLIFSCVSCFSLVVAIIAIKNKPKVRIEIIKQTNWGHAKQLWKQKYTTYNIIMISVFLGVSWTFLSKFSTLSSQFPRTAIYLNLSWILSGAIFGLLSTWLIQKLLSKTGNPKIYDYSTKLILFVGLIGNLMLGILVELSFDQFWLYLVAVILIGIGTIGFLGLAHMSLIQSLYPIPPIVIGTIVALFASIYSIISLALSQIFLSINAYFSIAAVTLMPWLYYLLTFETSFKRYKYYLNEKQRKFELLKVGDTQVSESKEE